jgi:hypothetical protein
MLLIARITLSLELQRMCFCKPEASALPTQLR